MTKRTASLALLLFLVLGVSFAVQPADGVCNGIVCIDCETRFFGDDSVSICTFIPANGFCSCQDNGEVCSLSGGVCVYIWNLVP